MIFTLMGCATTTKTHHPELFYPTKPQLPHFSREMLDCGQHNPATLSLCLRIKEREAVLSDHIYVLEQLIDLHNELLRTSE